MAWKKGQSGNPRGRPPKSQALTEILRRLGSRTIEDTDGRRRARKRVVARLLWDIVTTGRALLPVGDDGKTQVITVKSFRDWFECVKWLYERVDGPPRQEIDVTSGGQPIQYEPLVVILDADVPRDTESEQVPT